MKNFGNVIPGMYDWAATALIITFVLLLIAGIIIFLAIFLPKIRQRNEEGKHQSSGEPAEYQCYDPKPQKGGKRYIKMGDNAPCDCWVRYEPMGDPYFYKKGAHICYPGELKPPTPPSGGAPVDPDRTLDPVRPQPSNAVADWMKQAEPATPAAPPAAFPPATSRVPEAPIRPDILNIVYDRDNNPIVRSAVLDGPDTIVYEKWFRNLSLGETEWVKSAPPGKWNRHHKIQVWVRVRNRGALPEPLADLPIRDQIVLGTVVPGSVMWFLNNNEDHALKRSENPIEQRELEACRWGRDAIRMVVDDTPDADLASWEIFAQRELSIIYTMQGNRASSGTVSCAPVGPDLSGAPSVI